MGSSTTTSFAWLLPVLLALAVNVGVLQNGFVWYDKPMVEKVAGVLDEKTTIYYESGSPNYYRSVVSWAMQIEWLLFGDEPFGYHLTLWLAHALSTFLVYLCARGLFHGSSSLYLAVLTASLFAIHPAHSEAVAWISGRSDVFMTVFLLFSIWAFLRYLSRNHILWTGPLIAIGFILAILSKETAVGFAPVFLLFYWFNKDQDLPTARKFGNPIPWIPLMVVLIYGFFRSESIGVFLHADSWNVVSIGKFFETVMLTYGYYLRLVLFPHPLNAFVLELPSQGLNYFFLITLSLLFFGSLIWFTVRGKSMIYVIGGWWFVFGLLLPSAAPFSSFFQTPVAERFSYFPSIGLIFAGSYLILGGWSWIQEKLSIQFVSPDIILLVLLLLFVGTLSLLTIARNQVWQNSFTLWTDTVEKSPQTARPHLELGRNYEQQGKWIEARVHYLQAYQGRGSQAVHAMAANNYAYILIHDRELDEAERVVQNTLMIIPDHPILRYTIGYIYWERAVSPGSDEASKKYLESARYQLNEAAVLDPNFAETYYLLGLVDLRLNRRGDARSHFERVVELDPNSPQGRFAHQMLLGLRPFADSLFIAPF